MAPPLVALVQAHAQGHAPTEAPAEGFNAGKTIIEHVANSGIDHPLVHLPKVFGIDFSVTKHVFMLWVVAALVFAVVTVTVRRYLRQDRRVPSGLMNGLEAVVEFIRDSIVQPNVGRKWANTWTPLVLTFFVFILCANAIGLIPIFEIVGLIDHYVLHSGEESFLKRVLHGGTTATANFNVTAALATITFGSIIAAGSKAHGFIQHWKNLAPPGLAWPIYIILIPIEIMGMFVRPFALTMRLAANMTGGHIAILAILSFVFLFAELFGRAIAGIGVGLVVSVPLAAAISALEILVVLIQAYVFTLLTAVFIGMAIHAHH
ncbi:MAG: F0F1 ATP synthase subunit A [Vicinamibacterales bacterium]